MLVAESDKEFVFRKRFLYVCFQGKKFRFPVNQLRSFSLRLKDLLLLASEDSDVGVSFEITQGEVRLEGAFFQDALARREGAVAIFLTVYINHSIVRNTRITLTELKLAEMYIRIRQALRA